MFVILGGLFIVGCADFFNVNCESTSKAFINVSKVPQFIIILIIFD
jgi:hypothetical protein